jgi:hypothetical protein
MRLIEGEEEDSDSRSDMLEMPNPRLRGKDSAQDGHRDGAGDGDRTVHHTEEYWKSSSDKTRADWVKEEEGLNRGHRASESFAVLNELVVVLPFLPWSCCRVTCIVLHRLVFCRNRCVLWFSSQSLFHGGRTLVTWCSRIGVQTHF